MWWSTIISINLYDFLGLCQLVPVQTNHIPYPYVIKYSKYYYKINEHTSINSVPLYCLESMRQNSLTG